MKGNLNLERSVFLNRKKVLKNIIPLEDVFYKRCYNHTRICIAKHFRKSDLNFYANDIFTYGISEKKGNKLKIKVQCKSIENEDDLMRKIGILSNKKVMSGDVIKDIKTSLDVNRPVIAYVDNFFWPPDTAPYFQKHNLHGIMIYGYNDYNKKFNIIEPWGFQTKQPLATKIDFDILEKAYYSVETFIRNKNIMREKETYFEYYLDENNIQSEKKSYKKLFYRNFLCNTSVILSGFECLELISLYLISEVDFNDRNNMEILFKKMYKVTLNKVSQKYATYRLFGVNSYEYKILEVICSEWIMLQALFWDKMNFDKYNIDLKIVVPKKILEIKELENRLFEAIYKLAKK